MVATVVLLFALPASMPEPLPVEFSVGLALIGGSKHWELREADNPDAPPIPVWQSEYVTWGDVWGEKPLCALIPPPTTTQRPVRYVLRNEWPHPQEHPFAFEEVDREKLVISEAGKTVLAYNYGMMLADGVPEDRRRSCYVHPLLGLDGEQISGDFERDHYHHRGLFWAWPHMTVSGLETRPTTPGDREVSLWDLRGIQARFEKWLGRDAGSVCAVFGVQNGWYVGEERVAKEEVWFRVWRATETGRAIDVRLTLAAKGAPIALLGATGKGYGGLCLRVRSVEAKTVTKPDGRTVQTSDEERLPWADLSAKFGAGDAMSGAAVFIGSGNPGFPNGWCLREYGFLGVDWPGLQPVTLEPGKPVELSYRVWVHRGDVKAGQVEAAYRNFAQPVEVTVVE